MDQGRIRVLLVDDEDSFRVPLRRYLATTFEYKVDDVATAAEARRQVQDRSRPYDVALVDDLLMPEPGVEPEHIGIELIEEIHKHSPETECIVLTGWGKKRELAALQAGAYRYLGKPFDPEELALLIRTAAQQVRLRAIGRAILAERELGRVLEGIAGAACSLAPADEAAIVLLEPTTGKLEMHTRTYPADLQWWRHFAGEDLSRRIIDTGQMERVPDTTQDGRVNAKVIAAGIRSFVGLPIPGEQANLGVLYVYWYKTRQVEEWGTVAVLQTLAGQAGLAIANARAFHQIRAHAGYMEAMVQAGQGLTKATLLEEQLKLAWEFVRTQLQVTTFFVALYDEASDTLRFPLFYDKGETLPVGEIHLGNDPEKWGLAGYVAKKKEELYWPTAQKKEETCARLGLVPYRIGDPCESCFCLPLLTTNRTIGVLSIQSYVPHAFSPILLDAFRALGSQLTVAFENTRLLERTQRTAEQSAALNRIVYEIGTEPDTSALLRRVVEEAAELLGTEGGGAYLLDPRGENRNLIAEVGLPPVMWERPLQRNEGLGGVVLETGQPLAVDSYWQWDKRFELLDEHKLTAVAAAPIRIGDRILGILVVHDSRASKRFVSGDLALLQQLADHAGLILQKVDLVDRLRAIQDVSTAITSSLEYQAVLNHTCRAAVELFDVEHSGLVLFDDDLEWGTVQGEYPADLHAVGTRIPVKGVAAEEKLAYQGEPVHCFDLEQAGLEFGQVREILRGLGICSISIVPIIYKGRVLGSFSLDAVGRPRRFSPEEIQLCKVFAAQVAVAIENAQLYEETRHREQLLETLDEASRHIRAERETSRLLHEIVRLAVRLGEGTAGCLFVHRPHLGQLELQVTYQLPPELAGIQLSNAEGLVGQVARTGRPRFAQGQVGGHEDAPVFDGCDFHTAMAVPLGQTGQVEAVLLVVYDMEVPAPSHTALEVLERFAVQAGIAWQTSRLMGREQRMLAQLGILHEISNYIQAAGDLDKILHVVLTGVTASYGLGFNRASLFLLDERREYLVGQMGIGHLDEAKARRDWRVDQNRGLDSFQKYLALLEAGDIPLTPVGERTVGLRFPATSEGFWAFMDLICKERCFVVTAADLAGIPPSFIEALEPDFPLVVVPLMARGQPIGLLVADNKFTRSPVTAEDKEALLTFVNTAAVAIDNAQLFQEAKVGRDRLRSFYEASNALVSSHDLAQVLRDVVGQARVAAQASSVSMILIDPATGEIRHLITAGIDGPVERAAIVRPNGLSMQVMRTGTPEIIVDSENDRDRVNPSVFWRKIAAALCLPLILKDETIGVMWFHYGEPRCFSQAEIDAGQLYANQAALAYDSARRIKELEHMRRAAEALAGAAGLAEVLNQIVLSAREVLQADSAAIWCYDDVRDKFMPEQSVASGIPPELWDEFRIAGPWVGQAAFTVLERGSVAVDDVGDMERYRFLAESTPELLGRLGVKSFQGIALKVGRENLGVLYVNYDTRRSFREREQEVVRTFAHHAALALKKAKLLEQLGEARDVARVVARVTALEDLRSTLNSIVNGTLGALGCDAVTLYTYHQEDGEFGWPPAMAGVQDEAAVLAMGRVTETSVIRNILALERPYQTEDARADGLLQGPFVEREGIRSSIGIPLRVGERKVGVMFVNYRAYHRFTMDELTNIELFANQAAVAIRNAQLFQVEQHHAQALEAIQATSAAVSGVLDRGELLPMITEKAAEIFRVQAVSLMLWNEQRDHLIIRAAVGLGEEYQKKQQIPRSIVEKITQEHGMNAMVFDIGSQPLGRPELVRAEGLHSVLVTPLMLGGELNGILNIYSRQATRRFDEQEKKMAGIFANHAAIAIQNAQAYEELNRTKGQLAARSCVAWVGMVSANWRHRLDNHAVAIQDLVRLAREDLATGASVARVLERLSLIDDVAQKIRSAPITAPLQEEEGVVSVSMNSLVRERVSQIWGREPYKSVDLQLDLGMDESATVRASPDWLRRALDIVIDNAVEAMTCSPSRQLTIATRPADGGLELTVSDTGSGIPQEVRDKLFQAAISRSKGEKGLGVGLLLADTIVQTYGGSIEVGATGPAGTSMVMWFPVERGIG